MDELNSGKEEKFRDIGMKVSQFLRTRKGRLLPEEEHELPAILNSIDKDVFHFRDEEPFKEGGEKRISRAYDTRTDRKVAIARPRDFSNQLEKEAFLREARITSKLQHPNILPVYQIGLDPDDVPYFVMRLLRGEDLGTIQQKTLQGDSGYVRTYTREHLLGVFLKLCDAMIYAHSQGVLHLDIKPANVMIGRFGQVHLLDWGLSVVKEVQKGTLDPDLLNTVSYAGTANGTPGYMAPEQLSGIRDDSYAADVYSLGAVLYFMLTGTIPVEGSDAAEVQNNARAGRVVSPQKRRPGMQIPDSLEAITMKALALNPAERYQSVQELRDDVLSYTRGFAPSAERAGIIKRMQLLVKRHNEVSTAIMIAGISLIALFAFFYQRERLQSHKLDLARAEAVQNLERFKQEQAISNMLHDQMLGFTGNVANFSDVSAFPDAYEFMVTELGKPDLDPDYRERLRWNKTLLELANQQFNAAMRTIDGCPLDKRGIVFEFARKYAELKPNDRDLLTEEQFAEFLSENKGSIRSRRFGGVLLALAFDLDVARRGSPEPTTYVKVILAYLNHLNNSPGWGEHVMLEEVEGGYHLDLSNAPYMRYRLARMAPVPVFDKLQLVSLNLSGNEFRLEDNSPFTGNLETLILLDVNSWDMTRFFGVIRKLPVSRLVLREGFLKAGQLRTLRRDHEVIVLPEGQEWIASKSAG
jgi:tRNA A-37 threonylcarbamoyl transferase component Bud32